MSAEGAFYTSLGQRPRKRIEKGNKGWKPAPNGVLRQSQRLAGKALYSMQISFFIHAGETSALPVADRWIVVI